MPLGRNGAPAALTGVGAGLESINFRTGEHGSAIADGASVGQNSYLGRGVILYPGVQVGASCTILDGAVIGRIPISNGTTTRPVHSAFGAVVIGNGSVIGCNAVIYTDNTFGARVLIGDLASVREGCRIGDGVILGRGVMALYNCSVGAYSRIQDQVHLVGDMVVEEHVFIGMGVVTTNDNSVYIGRFGIGGGKQRGPTIRRYAVVGAGATILPNLEIGEGALVGAGAVVTRDVPPWSVVTGVPARVVRPIPDDWRAHVIEGAARLEQLQSSTRLMAASPQDAFGDSRSSTFMPAIRD
jgi:acetyltransferase-like isoleucine patch superfamily enzyme